jgi:tetraacyldisaccharide 4'-kinase
MRVPWQATADESGWAQLLALPLAPLAGLYRLGAWIDRGRYKVGLAKTRKVDARVVSVGSLVVGGSGKTPMASWLAEQLHRRGVKVALLSRGYGGRSKNAVTVVSDGSTIFARPDQAGDEPVMLAGQVAGVPVVVGKDRGLAALRAIALSSADVLVLDDGFQHYGLHRDLDIVTFDGAFGVGNGSVLPRGPLRESLSGLARVDAVGVLDDELPASLAKSIDALAPDAYRFGARRVAVSLRSLDASVCVSPNVLRGMKVGMMAGIARPASLRESLEALGAEVVAHRTFPDHHRYRQRDLRGLSEEAEVWITTEKDAGKILPSWARGPNGNADVRVLGVRLSVNEPEAFMDWLASRLELDTTPP